MATVLKIAIGVAAGIIAAIVLLVAGCSALVVAADSTPDTTSAEVATSLAPDSTSAPVATSGQENARRSAESYLSMAAFSRSGLIEQLVFEGYSSADSTVAVDSVGADWNGQATESARTYLKMSGFSRTGLIEQLVFDGFTQAQATHGVDTA